MVEEKQYYTIREVTRIFGVSERIIYRIEEEGLVRASRDEGSRRRFTPEDLEQIRLIVELSRELGVNWAGIEVILHMRERMLALQREMREIFDQLPREMKDSPAGRAWELHRQSLPKMDIIRILEESSEEE
ncbi:MAG: MerR family transcriptional regulator [Desulfobacteraceae bacterium]|nr:MerR family transcriptional regulator [Desulfobacteraceae bacterium]